MPMQPEQIARLEAFVCDLDIDTGIPWQPGALLAKSDVVLVGTRHACKPSASVRLAVFACQAAQAPSGHADPWKVAAIDRSACFVLADVYRVGSQVQCALVELGAKQLESGDVGVSPRAVAAMRRSFDDALDMPAHRFAQDALFCRVVQAGTERLEERFEAVDADAARKTAFDLPDAIPVASATVVKMGFATEAGADESCGHERPMHQEAQGGTPAEPTASHRPSPAANVPAAEAGQSSASTKEALPCAADMSADVAGDAALSDESWIVALAESILSESAAQSYLAADANRVQHEPDGTADQPTAQAAAQALYASMHTEGQDISTSQELPSAESAQRSAADAATALYETLHLGEAHLDELPSFTCMPAPNGLEFLQADDRTMAAHPALEHAEAQRNFARLLQRHLDARLVERLYCGNAQPSSAEERLAESRRLWFDPLSGCEFAPILSTDADSYLEALRETYASQLPDQADGARPSAAAEKVARQLALVSDALAGDLQAVATLIDQEVRSVQLPYRYQFSASFDLSQRTALVNLFLPQKALFPLALQADGATDMHSASGFNRRYQNAACALGVMTLMLVKMHAAWVQDLALNAWYRTEGSPDCVFTLRTDERTLAELCTRDTEMAFTALKNMKARIHSGNHHELLPLEPAFALHDGLDMMFGFKAFANGWVFPPAFKAITATPSAHNLDAALNMISDMLAQGLATQAYRTARTHEQSYRAAWLDALPQGVHALSCDNQLEEQASLALLEGHPIEVLPRRLGQLYHILGAVASSLGVDGQAATYLDKAIWLNPASALSLLERSNVAAKTGDEQAARSLVQRAREFAYSPYALAQAVKQQGWWAAHDAQYEAAYYLYCYSRALYESDAHKELCHERISACLAAYRQVSGDRLRKPGQPAVASLGESMAWLRNNGWATGIGPLCWQLAKEPVEKAIAGGPLPDASFVDAYMTGMHACADSLSEVRSLILNVYDVRFGNFPFSDYLHKPIMLVDADAVYTLDARLGLAPAQAGREACLLAIPYIDPHVGLMLQVLGSIDLHTHETVCALPSDRPLKLPARPYRDTAFLLLRSIDLPDFDIEGQAAKLAADHAVGEARDATRGRRDVDLLRDFGNPDDVLVLLVAKGLQPEGVWGRLEAVGSDGTLFARIENEPFDDFGVHAGDVCQLVLDADPESGLVLAYAGKVVG